MDNLFSQLHLHFYKQPIDTTYLIEPTIYLLLDNASTCDMLFGKDAPLTSITLYTNIYIYVHFTRIMNAINVKHKNNCITCVVNGITIILFNKYPTSMSSLNIKHLFYDFVSSGVVNILTKTKHTIPEIANYSVELINSKLVKAHTVFELYELSMLYSFVLPKIFILPVEDLCKHTMRLILKNLEHHNKLNNNIIKHINESLLIKRILNIPLIVKIELNDGITINSIETFILTIWLSLSREKNIKQKKVKKCDDEFTDYSDRVRDLMANLNKLKTLNAITNELITNTSPIQLMNYELESIKMDFTIINILTTTKIEHSVENIPLRIAYIIFKYGHVCDDDYFKKMLAFSPNCDIDIVHCIMIKNNDVLKKFNREIIELIPLFASLSPKSTDAINIYDLQHSIIYIYENMLSNKKQEINMDRCYELFHVIFSGIKINMFMQTSFNSNYLLKRFGTDKLIEEVDRKTTKENDKNMYDYYKTKYAELKKYAENSGVITI